MSGFKPIGSRTVRVTESDGCSVGRPSWLPDGSGLIFESNCGVGTYEIYRGNLSFTLNDAGELGVTRMIRPQEAERLTSNNTDDHWPRVSPDGERIAFFSNRDGNTEIYTMSIAGGNQTRLTNNPSRDEGPVWSPDGAKIAFNSDRDGDHEIFVVNADGSALTQLTSNTVDDGFTVWGQ